jgi:hypothetical protein
MAERRPVAVNSARRWREEVLATTRGTSASACERPPRSRKVLLEQPAGRSIM